MSYLQRNKQRRGSIKSISLRLAIVVSVLFLGSFLVRFIAVGAYASLGPVRYGVDQAILFGKSFFYSRYALSQQIIALENERDGLKAKVNELRVYEHFATQVVGTTSNQGFPARVISRPPYVQYDMLLLNKGSKDGVLLGQKVLTSSTSLPIGTITSVDSHSSYVTLFSNPDQRNEIEIGTSTAVFEAVGAGNGVFESRVPRAISVKVGDVIRMPQMSIFPLSSIEHVQSSDSDPFATIRFMLPARFDQLEFVTIIP